MDEITLKDEMLLLEETQINNTFLDTTPQEKTSSKTSLYPSSIAAGSFRARVSFG